MPELIKLPQGTVEHLIVDVADRLGNITDLTSLSPTFRTRLRYDAADVETGSATAVGMTAYCLVDTTTYDPGIYELYLSFSNPPETPVLGPFEFEVNA